MLRRLFDGQQGGEGSGRLVAVIGHGVILHHWVREWLRVLGTIDGRDHWRGRDQTLPGGTTGEETYQGRQG